MGEEGKPEGIIFIHIEHAGNAYGTAGSVSCFQRLIVVEQAVVLYLVHIRQRLTLFGRRTGSAPFTAVPRDERPAVIKGIDREKTIIGAQTAVAD